MGELSARLGRDLPGSKILAGRGPGGLTTRPCTRPAGTALNLEYNASLLGEPLECTVVGNLWLVNDAEVMLADIPAANGMIHRIADLLVPTTSTSNYGP